MKKRLALSWILVIFLAEWAYSQPIWTWEELNPMPISISNNAVCEVVVDDETYVCTFGGIDSTKTLQGISGISMRMAMSTGEWEQIPDLPDTLGKIASGANTVDGIIYIIGGYHVFSGPPYELSSDRVHRYDPVTNTYLSDGAPVPVPIDDQVQAVWRDSLIYVVTGWSQNQNVADVQIYDPALDQWSVGTSVPNNSNYKAFGASGVILGDTIFYHGGAVGSSFSASGRMRKGVIDPDDPTQITWSEVGNYTDIKGYRMAAVAVNEQAWWIGGSAVTYNYNGIAYNGSGGVPALTRIFGLSQSEPVPEIHTNDSQPYGVMDLRGLAKISANEIVICGGMMGEQEVSNRAFRLTYSAPNGLVDLLMEQVDLISNLLQTGEGLQLRTPFDEGHLYKIFDLKGQLLQSDELKAGETHVELSQHGIVRRGQYLLLLENGSSVRFTIQ